MRFLFIVFTLLVTGTWVIQTTDFSLPLEEADGWVESGFIYETRGRVGNYTYYYKDISSDRCVIRRPDGKEVIIDAVPDMAGILTPCERAADMYFMKLQDEGGI